MTNTLWARGMVGLVALTLSGACGAPDPGNPDPYEPLGVGGGAGEPADNSATPGAAGSADGVDNGSVDGTAGSGPEEDVGGDDDISGDDPGDSVAVGTCCPDGNCLCHGPDPVGLTSANGSYRTASFRVTSGTVYYPTNAEAPFAGVALCGGFLNSGPEMAGWGPFYASHGIVTLITNTGAFDIPAVRSSRLLAAVDELKREDTRAGSALFGKMSDRYGSSGYSLGGGGTTIASAGTPSLKSSVGLAAWAPTGLGVRVPTLLLCGGSDGIAPCSGSQGAYNGIPAATPKMIVTIPLTGHLNWFGPRDAGAGTSGSYALAFQKVYLEGDQRWKRVLLQAPAIGTAVSTNIR